MASNTISPPEQYVRIKRERSDDEDEDGAPQGRRQRTGEPTSDDDDNNCLDSELEAMKRIVLNDLSTENEERVSNGMDRLYSVLRNIHDRFGHDGMKQLQKRFVHLGGHAFVVRVMNEFSGRKTVQQFGLCILAVASYQNKMLQTAIAHVDGIPAIVRAMQTFDSDEGIQCCGLLALRTVAFHEDNAKLFISLGGIGIILDKMKTFPDNANIVFEACKIINFLSIWQELRGHLLNADARTALAIAMDGHKKDKNIQELAGQAMKRLMEHSASL